MFSLSILALPLMAAPLALAQTYASTTTFTFSGNALPTGLVKSDWPIGKYPHEHLYVPENVVVEDGFLNLKVDGGHQSDELIRSAEISTDFTVASARVETYAVLSEVAGVCNGMFLYESDTQEVDIEWLSDPESQSNIDSGRDRALFYTNQAVEAEGENTHDTSDPPVDATSAVHNYRIDWDGTSSTFYVDDKLQYKFNTNVPTAKDGHWMWNNWSNGDKDWTAGPPATDAVFKIQKIVMYYNPGP